MFFFFLIFLLGISENGPRPFRNDEVFKKINKFITLNDEEVKRMNEHLQQVVVDNYFIILLEYK